MFIIDFKTSPIAKSGVVHKMTSCRRGGGGGVQVRMTNNVEGGVKKA